LSHQVRKHQKGSPVAAGISGAVYGGISGALIGWSFSGRAGALTGALIGAIYFGLAEAITDARRQPGQLKPLWHRLIGTTVVGAALAVVVSVLITQPTIIGLIMGFIVGLTGLGPRKLALGIGIGLALGVIATVVNPQFNPATLGGAIVLVYRLFLLLVFKDSAPVTLSAEHVPASEAKYVVPFEAHTKYIGADYMESLAREADGSFKRNQPGIGIVETMDALGGPTFDPAQVDPLIREFYEHTSRFKLSIEPRWNPFMKPFFRIFKTYIAQRIGQANLPFNTEEAHRGMVSYIDTIDYKIEDDAADHISTLRGWIRAYEDSGEAIYVGIYTIVRYQDTGYVSVGFPLPESNFTATLLPYNNGRNFILKTKDTGSEFPGHYLTDIDDEDGSLTILKLPTMGEEIDVYVRDGRLKTDHSFYFGGFKFLTLFYSMERKPEAN
jgi:hypothetical protein